RRHPGEKIVFVGGSHVLVANADGTRLRDLSRPAEDAFAIAVSPDGTRTVVDLLGCCLVLMNANGSGRVRISNAASSPVWAPDGKHLAYADESHSGNVHIVSATGRARRTLPVAADGFARLAWS